MTKRINRKAQKLGWSHEKKDLFIRSLGTAADRVIAETFGLDFLTFVFACRKDLGIARFQKPKQVKVKKEKEPFLPEALIERLGTIPDAHLAEEFGVGKTTVGRARRERGIPNNKCSVDTSTIQQIRTLLLQKDTPDSEIARLMDLGVGVVTAQRKKLGLEPLDRRSSMTRFLSFPAQVALLGTANDAELGRRWGCSRETVRGARQKRGIPAFVPPGWKRVGSHGSFTEPEE